MIGDTKPSETDDESDFDDTQVGHILDMVQELLTKVQPWRLKCISFLTDTRRFQFFLTRRTQDGYNHYSSPVFKFLDGWRILLGLLLLTPEDLGYEDYSVDGVCYENLLGNSGKTMVFSTNEQNIVKVFDSEQSQATEANNLRILQELLPEDYKRFVPRLLVDNVCTRNSKPAIMTSPQCNEVQPHGNPGEVVYGRDIAQLVTLLKQCHETAGLVHRDIKPANIFKYKNSIFLNDWGSAVKKSDQLVRYEGTYGFGSRPSTGLHVPSPKDDLVALARSAYLMLFNHRPPHPDVDTDIDAFWNYRFNQNTIWREILSCTNNLDYDRLCVLYIQIK
jgi:hypothetical protein